MPNLALAVYLLNEKIKKKSPFLAYLNLLPNEFNLPIYYSIDELKLFKSSQFLSEFYYQNILYAI